MSFFQPLLIVLSNFFPIFATEVLINLTMNNAIRTLTIKFENEIQQYEVPMLRGCFLSAMNGEANVLFHNHIGDKLRYSFPLIQYKRIGKKACVLCVHEGTEVIGQFFNAQSFNFRLGERMVEMQIEAVMPRMTTIQVWDSTFHYNLRRWLPFNSQNYETYKKTESQTERMSQLEHILVGNILSMAKGLGINFDRKITCSITNVSEPHIALVKQTKLMMLDVKFQSNVSLPQYIGIGRHSSIGFGIVTQDKIRDNNEQQTSAQ